MSAFVSASASVSVSVWAGGEIKAADARPKEGKAGERQEYDTQEDQEQGTQARFVVGLVGIVELAVGK